MNRNGLVVVLVIIVLILIAIIGYATYSSPNSEQNENYTEQTQTPAAPTDVGTITGTTTPTNQQAKVFNVTGQNFSFSPSTITVNKGDKVRIVFTSNGGLHDFVLDGFGVKTAQLSSAQQQTVEFTADKAGTFEYYCSVATHRQMGMVGKLIVK